MTTGWKWQWPSVFVYWVSTTGRDWDVDGRGWRLGQRGAPMAGRRGGPVVRLPLTFNSCKEQGRYESVKLL